MRAPAHPAYPAAHLPQTYLLELPRSLPAKGEIAAVPCLAAEGIDEENPRAWIDLDGCKGDEVYEDIAYASNQYAYSSRKFEQSLNLELW